MQVRYADPEEGCLADLVDLDKYPLPFRGEAQPGKYRGLIESAQAQLAVDGLVQLSGFLRSDAVALAQRELQELARLAEVQTNSVSVYSRGSLLSDRDDDPRTRSQLRCSAHITRDMFGPHTVAHRMYVSPALKRLVADCVGVSRAFEFADPLAGLIATVLAPGGVIPWHYDSNEFIVSLMIDGAEDGGQFEYVPDLRQAGDENVAGLADVLDNADHPAVRRPLITAGDLQIFRGRHSLHRVTTVGPGRTRIVALFGYAAEPGVVGPVDRTRAVYGRVTEAHLVAEQAAQDRAAPGDGLIR